MNCQLKQRRYCLLFGWFISLACPLFFVKLSWPKHRKSLLIVTLVLHGYQPWLLSWTVQGHVMAVVNFQFWRLKNWKLMINLQKSCQCTTVKVLVTTAKLIKPGPIWPNPWLCYWGPLVIVKKILLNKVESDPSLAQLWITHALCKIHNDMCIWQNLLDPFSHRRYIASENKNVGAYI